ncbi:response regulator transcription factor [Sphingomonas parva]|uniref:Response regulator transcription factor n=1 Tax=Sphingomonas parva TaxID=2555898 RepID=A0A4Y8ZKP8_9SPHN|nr:LuxR C-terminal-related transcriptional regulator [Sphingomonas parva]TFI56534.1 response regulator transcription factor [Sphingomonas parva]
MSHQRMVYVVDHDLGSRRAITSHLASLGAEAWPFATAGEFLDIVDHLTPACVLLEVDLVGGAGLDILSALAARDEAWPLIATSARIEVRLAVEAMKLGALDVLQKPIDLDALAGALIPAWERLQHALASGASARAAREQVARLTPREVEIVLALLAGQANKAVAHALGISVRTVEMHRAHIMAKLGVRSLAEAALIAARAGLTPTPRAANAPGPWAKPAVPALPLPAQPLAPGLIRAAG